MPDRVLALLTGPAAGGQAVAQPFAFADPAAPQLSVLDLAATRGDGVFETLGVGGGRAQALDAHLARLERSAALLELPPPDLDAWRSASVAVAAALPAERECFMKLVYSRGVEGAAAPTGWVVGDVAPDHTAARTAGIRVALLDRGVAHDAAGTAPWLLLGAKTLSYAVNLAALREARRRDADDALFVSADGHLLEGATSSLLVRRGDRMLTPSTSLGILAGTTQADAFAYARSRGMTTSYDLLPTDALDSADGLWLLSSVRQAAPIRAVDGVERPVDAAFTAELNAYLLARRE